MIDKVFIDTNIWLYALTIPKDGKDLVKRESAIDVLKKLVASVDIVVSAQVVNELHWNLLKKFCIDDVLASTIVQKNIEPISVIKELSYLSYRTAAGLRRKYSLSFWDSLIVSSALEGACKTLYSEDMQHGLTVNDQLVIINPFGER